MTLNDLLDIIKNIQFYKEKEIKALDNTELLNYYNILRVNHQEVIAFFRQYIDSGSCAKTELASRMKELSTSLLEAELDRQSSNDDVTKMAALWLN